jgi:hypothetical protein
LLEVGQGYLADVDDGVQERPDDLGVDEGGELVELLALTAMPPPDRLISL